MYDKILSKMSLSEKDRAELKSKRGFNDETINYFNLKSPFTASESLEIVRSIGKTPLQRERLLNGDNICHALRNNGIIPFFETDKDGNRKCIRVQGHKYFIKGKEPLIFDATREGVDELFICESEYKAMAMWQLGYSAIGLSGITKFVGKYFHVLLSKLCSIRPSKCIIVFDNDDKASPESDKFTSNPSARYDCFKYQWYLAHTLRGKGIDSYVANLPDSWRINGGCDIDGCLAAGKTKGDFDKVFQESMWLSPDEFKETWIGTGEMDNVLTPWADAKLKSTHIKVKKNCMWSTDKKGEPLKLTNFDMYVTTIHTDEDNNIISRYVTVINEFGKKFQEVQIENSDLSSSGKFSTWCLGHPGNIVYSGEPRNMHEIGTYLNTVSTPTTISHTGVIGYNKKYDSFLFHEGAYKDGVRYDAEGGRMFLPDGAVEVDSLYGDGDMPFEMSISTDKFNWRTAIDKMVKNYGDGKIRIVIAWLAASTFADVFERCMKPKLFPLLWVTGAMGSGKNTLLQQSMSFIGIHGFEGIAINQVTQPSIWKQLSYLGSIPLWVDELRDDKHCRGFDGVWRSAYNRTCTSKSKMNTDKDVIAMKVRGTVALTGQDISSDTALNQRFIPIRISKRTRSGLLYNWINNNCKKFSYMMHEMLTDRDAISDFIESNIELHKAKWRKVIDDDRLAMNVAVVSVMADALGINLEKNFSMKGWAKNMFEEVASGADDLEFLEGVSEIINAEPALATTVFSGEIESGKLFIYYSYAYSLWKMSVARKGDVCMGRKAVEDEMFSSGLAAKKSKRYVLNRDGNKIQVRGIDLDISLVPEELLSSIAQPLSFCNKVENGRFAV